LKRSGLLTPSLSPTDAEHVIDYEPPNIDLGDIDTLDIDGSGEQGAGG
jgi:hypothetical protein